MTPRMGAMGKDSIQPLASGLHRIATDSIEYANARLRAQRTQLFTREDYSTLIGYDTVDEMIAYLATTRYEPYLGEAMLTHTGAAIVGTAVTDFLRTAVSDVVSLYTERNATCLVAIGARADIADLKTLVRGKLAGTAPATLIESFTGPGLTITPRDLAILANTDSLQDAVTTASLLKMPYASAFRVGARLIRSSELRLSEALAQFELVLDRTYYEWATNLLAGRRDKSKVTADYIAKQIDVSNLLLGLRAVLAQIDAPLFKDYYIEGGQRILKSRYLAIGSSRNIEDAIELTRATGYHRTLDEALGEYILSNSLSAFDTALQRRLYKEMHRTGSRDYLGMGLPAAYLLALMAEAANVRIIAHAKEFHIAPQIIEEELIGV